MASDHESEDDFNDALSPRAVPKPDRRQKPRQWTEQEYRDATMFAGGSWHMGSSEVSPDGGDIGNELARPRRSSIWQRLGFWIRNR